MNSSSLYQQCPLCLASLSWLTCREVNSRETAILLDAVQDLFKTRRITE